MCGLAHARTHRAATEPTWRLISWVVSKLKRVPCTQAKDNNSLPLFAVFFGQRKLGVKKKNKTKQNINAKEKARKKKEKCDWIKSRNPSHKE